MFEENDLSREELELLKEELALKRERQKKRKERARKAVKKWRKERRGKGKKIAVLILCIIVIVYDLYKYLIMGVPLDDGTRYEIIFAAIVLYCDILILLPESIIAKVLGVLPLILSILIGGICRIIEEALKFISMKGKPKVIKLAMGISIVGLILTALYFIFGWPASVIRRFVALFPKHMFPDVYKHYRLKFCFITPKEEKEQKEREKY